MANTTNFGWETPDDTDLVKDGALAMRTLGNAIDTSLVDLKGGTTGQVLSKNTNTDMDFVWTTPNVGDITEVQAGTGISIASGTGPIPVVTSTVATTFDAKGDLVVGTGADTFAKLTVGANNTVLLADSSTATGLRWGATSSGALVFINRTSFTNVASQAFDNVFSSTYKAYLIVIETINAATGGDDLQLQFRYAGPTTETGATYYANSTKAVYNSATITNSGTTAGTSALLADETNQMSGFIYMYRVGNTSEQTLYTGSIGGNASATNYTISGITNQARTYTGFLLKSSSTNITGTVATYGLATA